MSKELVLITGATGHLGFRTLVILLQSGYRARVTVRRLEQAETIKNTTSVKPYLDSIDFVQVADITTADAYNHAIKGVSAVIHIASPLFGNLSPGVNDWKKLLYDPAEKGTLSLLSAAAGEPSVKRVVITSSVIVLELKNGSKRIGPYDLKAVPDQNFRDNITMPAQAYVVSKILAHDAGTRFVEDNDVEFDLVRVLPGYIQGANELYTSAEQMRSTALGSNEGTMNTAFGNIMNRPRLTHQVFLDDVAKAHVLALKPEVAKNMDNLVIAGNGGNSTPWAEYVPLIKRLFPEAISKGIIDPKAEDENMNAFYDVSSSEKALGFTFAGDEVMVKSVVGQYVSFVEAA